MIKDFSLQKKDFSHSEIAFILGRCIELGVPPKEIYWGCADLIPGVVFDERNTYKELPYFGVSNGNTYLNDSSWGITDETDIFEMLGIEESPEGELRLSTPEPEEEIEPSKICTRTRLEYYVPVEFTLEEAYHIKAVFQNSCPDDDKELAISVFNKLPSFRELEDKLGEQE